MKKNRYLTKSVLFFAVGVSTLAGCRKESTDFVNPDKHYCNTYVDQFETIWQGLDQGYVFWERESKDWDSLHDALLPRFKAFDASGATDQQFSQAYTDMVRGLIDHHMYVQVRNLRTGNPAYASSASLEVASRPGYHISYFSNQVALLASMEGVSEYTSGTSTLPAYFALFPGNNGKKIAYLRFQSFMVTQLQAAVNYGQASSAAIAPFRAFYGTNASDGVTDGWAGRDEVEAVIVDVRGNGGGSLDDIISMICSLTPNTIDYGYTRTKEGLGRLDYSTWVPFRFQPHANHLNGDKKVVVLADCNSASCAELTARIVQLMPNGTFIGERTYGATCPLIPGGHDIFYSGVFGNYNSYGYYVYTSNFDVVNKDYASFEGVGITPDIECPLDQAALTSGHDNQLERALEYIRTGK